MIQPCHVFQQMFRPLGAPLQVRPSAQSKFLGEHEIVFAVTFFVGPGMGVPVTTSKLGQTLLNHVRPFFMAF